MRKKKFNLNKRPNVIIERQEPTVNALGLNSPAVSILVRMHRHGHQAGKGLRLSRYAAMHRIAYDSSYFHDNQPCGKVTEFILN